MKTLTRLALGLSTAAMAMALASAAEGQAYATAGGGISIPSNVRLDMKTTTLSAKVDDGWHGQVAVGYDTGPVRFELEASIARSSIESFQNSRRAYEVNDGAKRLDKMGMANVMLDLPLSRAVTFTIGGGAGLNRISANADSGQQCKEPLAFRVVNDDPREIPGATGGSCRDQGDTAQNAFAWQAIGGLDYRLSPNWSLGVTGRFIKTGNVKTAGKNLTTRETTFTQRIDYESTRVSVLIRRNF